MLQTTTTPNFGAGNLSGSFALGSTEDVTGAGVIDGGNENFVTNGTFILAIDGDGTFEPFLYVVVKQYRTARNVWLTFVWVWLGTVKSLRRENRSLTAMT